MIWIGAAAAIAVVVFFVALAVGLGKAAGQDSRLDELEERRQLMKLRPNGNVDVKEKQP